MPNKYLDSVGLAEYTSLVKSALNTKAPLASPALTGTPTAPTPTAGDDSTKIATTAFVQDAKDDANSYTDTEIATAVATEVSRADGKYLPFAGGTLTGAVNGVTPTAGDDSTKLATTEYVQEEIRQHANMPIGHEYFSFNPNIPQGSLPLFGGEYSRATYSDLWAWVQQQTGYLKTEAEWQTLSTANNGNVPYYSDGDGSTTFRVPSLKCWVKGANGTVTEVGSYLAAGLPNIEGDIKSAQRMFSISTYSGALYADTPQTTYYSNDLTVADKPNRILFDASRSNSIYGNSSTVQPPSVVGMWLVKAYGVVVDTGQIDEQQYIDDRIAALPQTFLPLAGGTMAGNIVMSETADMIKSTDEKRLKFFGGTSDTGGSTLALYGLNSTSTSTHKGGFVLSATDGTNQIRFAGKPDGTLTWAGKNIERVNANGFGYIRFESGLQICFNQKSGVSTTAVSVGYDAPFNSIPRVIVSSSSAVALAVGNVSTTAFNVKTASGSAIVYYICIGYWK